MGEGASQKTLKDHFIQMRITMDADIFRSDLLGKSSVRRRTAASKLFAEPTPDHCGILGEALQIEEQGKNSWKTKHALIDLIGLCGCKEHSEHLYQKYIRQRESGADILTTVSAQAFVRIERRHEHDVQPVLTMIESSDDFVVEGALEALGYDRMVPAVEYQAIIVERCWNCGADRPQGLSDPRYGLAAACAGWSPDLVRPFLLRCLNSDDVPLKYVAEESLKRKYVKLRSRGRL